MSYRFHAGHRDRNHGAVVNLFLLLGCTVVELDAVGGGVPDLLVGAFGTNYLVEVKDGMKAPSRRKLRPSQVEFAKAWRGLRPKTVTTPEEARDLVKLWSFLL